ncbi:hypothetical protein Syun_003697 [Stephania yunnanensis]|uniref:Uncharacterized protein n=1 Tax=Stephania yunnanensis TaxID=152371 RepID=A0AAP0L490_9MAGN
MNQLSILGFSLGLKCPSDQIAILNRLSHSRPLSPRLTAPSALAGGPDRGTSEEAATRSSPPPLLSPVTGPRDVGGGRQQEGLTNLNYGLGCKLEVEDE